MYNDALFEDFLRHFQEDYKVFYAKELRLCVKCDCYAHIPSHVCFKVKQLESVV